MARYRSGHINVTLNRNFDRGLHPFICIGAERLATGVAVVSGGLADFCHIPTGRNRACRGAGVSVQPDQCGVYVGFVDKHVLPRDAGTSGRNRRLCPPASHGNRALFFDPCGRFHWDGHRNHLHSQIGPWSLNDE